MQTSYGIIVIVPPNLEKWHSLMESLPPAMKPYLSGLSEGLTMHVYQTVCSKCQRLEPWCVAMPCRTEVFAEKMKAQAWCGECGEQAMSLWFKGEKPHVG